MGDRNRVAEGFALPIANVADEIRGRDSNAVGHRAPSIFLTINKARTANNFSLYRDSEIAVVL
jgi:hypothetical protein